MVLCKTGTTAILCLTRLVQRFGVISFMMAAGLAQTGQADLHPFLLTLGVFGRPPVLSHLRFGREVRRTRLTPLLTMPQELQPCPVPRCPEGDGAQLSTGFVVQAQAGCARLSGVPCASAFRCLVPDHLSSIPWWRVLQKLLSLSERWPLPTPAKAADSHCRPAPPPPAGSEEGEEPPPAPLQLA